MAQQDKQRRSKAVWFAGCPIVLFGALQLWPAPPRHNPPVVASQTIYANLEVPPRVSGILHGVCGNCHSDETRWPWYSHIAPFSWWVGSDVNTARASMNFSEWSVQLDGYSGLGAAKLAAACAVLTADIMPPPRYRLLHPEARLSAADKQAFCAWTQQVALKSRASAATSDEDSGQSR